MDGLPVTRFAFGRYAPGKTRPGFTAATQYSVRRRVMRIQVNKKLLFRIFAFTLFILLAPFAFELVIMADIIGVEAAIAFLFTYGKSVALTIRDRIVSGFRILYAFISPEPSDVILTHERPTKVMVYSFIGIGLTSSIVISTINIVTLVSGLA